MSSPSIPQPPDLAEAAKQGVYADLETYPLRYLTTAASQAGGNVTIDGQNYDFTGLGDADNAKVMSDKMAQTLLNIQQNQGPAYVKQQLADLQQSDPKGYAMRQTLFDQIMKQADSTPDQPMATDLQNSIVSELQNAGRLDSNELNQVQQSVRGGQVARGNYLGTAATAQEAGAAVDASDALKSSQQQQAEGFLGSGVTPDDVNYRRMQQSLSNLGNFVNGQSPEAEFAGVSAAGNGAAPFVTSGPNGQTINPNAAQQGVSNALQMYSGNVNWAGQQVNPYVAGLSMAGSGLSAAYNLGYRPFAPTTFPTTPGMYGVNYGVPESPGGTYPLSP